MIQLPQWLLLPMRPSRVMLIGIFCASTIGGIGATSLLSIHDIGAWYLLVAACLIIASYKRSRVSIVWILCAGLLIGLWRGGVETDDNNMVVSYIGSPVTMTGIVNEDPTYGDRNELLFSVEINRINNRAHHGIAGVSTYDKVDLQRGDIITVSGKVREGFGPTLIKISYASVLSHNSSYQPILGVRDHFAAGVQQTVDEPMSGLGLGFLLGQRTNVDPDIDEQMKLLGLTHIVVASGYNLTILVRVARRLFEKLSKFQALVWSFGLMGLFVSITGFSPSMTRAAAVTSLALATWYYGRHIHPVVLILCVAAGSALWNPMYVWADVGWYLSFLSFIGVMLVGPLLARFVMRGDVRPPLLVQVALETIAAQLMTLPLILWLFGNLAVLSVVANLLVVPLIPLAMLLTFIAGVAGVMFAGNGAAIGVPVELVIGYMLGVSEWLSGFEWASFEVHIPANMMIGLYLLIVGAVALTAYRMKFSYLRVNITD